MSFEELIAGLGKSIGMELKVQDGLCGVNADGVPIIMRYIEPYGIVYIHADLGEPPPQGLETLYRKLLDSNHAFQATSGATLSVNPETGSVRLQRFDPYDVIAAAGASKVLVLFANVAAAWSALVCDYRDAPREGTGNSSDEGNLLGVRV